MPTKADSTITHVALTGRVASVTRLCAGTRILFEAGPELVARLNNHDVLLPEKRVSVSEATEAAMHAELQAWLEFNKNTRS